MGNEQIILTPMQVKELEYDLEKAKLDLEKAKLEVKSYKEIEHFKSNSGGDSHIAADDIYYEQIASLVTRIFDIESMLSNYVLANPTGSRVQIGSVVELADRDLRFIVVQNKVTKNSAIKEVSIESPIFGAIYMHKAGDICEYTVNGRACKCVIGSVDNEFTNEMALELKNDDSLGEKVKVR